MHPLIVMRLFRFYRRCGMPRWPAVKKAVLTALQP